MDTAMSIVAILFLGAALILIVMASLRMFKGIGLTGPQLGARGREQMRLHELARSGRRVPQDQAVPVREIVEQQLDMLERSEAARPFMMWSLGLFVVGTTLFGLGTDRQIVRLLLAVAVIMTFSLGISTFMDRMFRKYETTAEANGWITYSEQGDG